MSIFNEEQIKAMFSREYICHECDCCHRRYSNSNHCIDLGNL